MINVDITSKVLDEKYWRYEPPRGHYSRHMYRNSPFETDSDCGNCNGALCDICNYIIDPPHFECGIESSTLINIMIELGVPEDNAYELATSDYSYFSGDYYLIWPNSYNLENDYPEFFKKLNQEDEEIFKILDEFYKEKEFVPITDLYKKLNIDENDYSSLKRHHAENQYMMYKTKLNQKKKNEQKYNNVK